MAPVPGRLVSSLTMLVILLTACAESAPIVEPSIHERASQVGERAAEDAVDDQNEQQTVCRKVIYIANADGGETACRG